MARPSTKTLILIRHAHRDKPLGRAHDDGLSRKGRRQATEAARRFARVYDGKKPLILSSPKLRCVETVEPIAKLVRGEVKISSLLTEQREELPAESKRNFERRVHDFYRWWKAKGPALTIACSHGDWIPSFLKEATGAMASVSKGGWAEITIEEGKPELTWLLQNYDR